MTVTVIARTAAIGSCSKDTYNTCLCSTQFCYSSVPDHHYSGQSCTTETSGRTGDTARGTTLHSIRDTENEARGCRASSVCPLACPIFKIPFSVFIVFLISCCGRHCRSAPALETSLLKGASRPKCCPSYKVFCTQRTLLFSLVSSHEEVLSLPRTRSSEDLQVLAGEGRGDSSV